MAIDIKITNCELNSEKTNVNLTTKREAKKCNSGCKYYQLDHLETACILIDVFSVKKGEDCYIYEVKLDLS